MAGPWENYQSSSQPAATSGPWEKYQGQQSAPQQGADIVSEAEQKYGIPSGLLSAVISKESSGNPNAVSPKGAIGLGQVMPDTAKGMGYDPEQLKRDPNMQIDAAAQYLGQMLRRNNGDVTAALASYNWGPGNVQKYQAGQSKNMPAETQNYINDPRFAKWTQQQSPQPGSSGEMNYLSQETKQPWETEPESLPSPTLEQNLDQAARGIYNIPYDIMDAGVGAINAAGSAAAWAAGKAGLSDGKYYPMPPVYRPVERPTDPYAQVAEQAVPYLIPSVSSERTAAAAASVIGASRTERAANQVAGMLSENLVGTLAGSQQGGQIDPTQLLEDTGMGLVGSAAARLAPVAFNGVRNAVRDLRGAHDAPDIPQSNAGEADEISPAQNQDSTVRPQPETPPLDLQPSPQGQPQPVNEPTSQPTGNNGQEAVAPQPPMVASPTEETLRNVANSQPKDIASSLDGLNINPDQDILKSASDLGVADNLLPSHYSGNDQYRAVEQAIKSRKGSALQVQENHAISDLAKRSGQMIDEAAGFPDALSVSDRFNNEMNVRMQALEKRSDQLYSRVDNAMPPGKPVDAPQTLSYLESNADDLGGWSNLDPVEQRVYKSLTPGEDGVVTYANLNKQRRLIGQALGKNFGPYKDADQAALKRLYGALSQDQRSALANTGADRDFQVANRLVQMRKTLEDQSLTLRSKTLTGDVTYAASSALKSMQRGNGKGFRDLMDNIPSRKLRGEVLATGIRDMLSNGKRGADFSPGGFADWWQNMQASGQLRLLAQHVPNDLMYGLANVYNVARGIQRANRDHISTGALVEFTNRFNRVTQSHEMAAKYAQRVGLVVGAKAGPLGSLVGDSIGAKIADKARQMGGAGSADAAEKLISSPEFQAASKKASSRPAASVQQKAADIDTAARLSGRWREFFHSLPEADQRTIARVGLIGWLSSLSANNGNN